MGRGCAGVVIDRARNGLGTQTFEIWNDGPLDQDLLKLQKLDAVIRDGVYGTEHPLRHGGVSGNSRHEQDLFLDRRGKAQYAHDLSHPGARDALPAGDVGLVGDLA